MCSVSDTGCDLRMKNESIHRHQCFSGGKELRRHVAKLSFQMRELPYYSALSPLELNAFCPVSVKMKQPFGIDSIVLASKQLNSK